MKSTSIRRGVVVNWGALVYRVAISFFLMPYIVRKVGAASYGEYLFLVAILGYNAVLDLGFRAAILRYVGSMHDRSQAAELNVILGTINRYYIGIALLIFGSATAYWRLAPPGMIPDHVSPKFPFYVWLFSFVAASTFFCVSWASVVQARERYDVSNLFDVVAFTTRAVLVVVFLEAGKGIGYVIMADAANNVLSYALHRSWCLRVTPWIRPNLRGAKGTQLRKLSRYTVWAFLNSLSFQLRFRAPNVIVGSALDTLALSYFGVAGRMQSYVFQFGTALNAPFKTRIAVLEGREKWPELRELVIRGTRVTTYLAGSIAVVLGLYAGRFFVNWMGTEFIASALIMRIFLLAICLEISQLVLVGALYSVGRLRLLSMISFAEAVALVVLGVTGALRWGMTGAAIGVVSPIVFVKLFVQPRVALRCLEMSTVGWVRDGLVGPGLTLLGCAPVVWMMGQLWTVDSLAEVMLQMLAAGSILAGAGFLFVLSPDERAAFLGSIRARLDRVFARATRDD